MGDSNIEAQILAGQQAMQTQLSGIERSVGEMGQTLRGLTRDATDDRRRLEKVELQLADLVNERDRGRAIRTRDKGLVAAAATAIALLAAASRDIIAAIRSAV